MEKDKDKDNAADSVASYTDSSVPAEIQKWRHELITSAASGDYDNVKNMIEKEEGGANLNWSDDTSMTPLQYAAYTGNTDMVTLMLEQDCDPNFTEHTHKWTALHFAALSGNAAVCSALLDAGANPQTTNSISRTASQMAAFVGNHKIGATINTFIPRSEIEYFTKPREHQSEADLPPALLKEMHSFVTDVNLNPIRIALNLPKRSGLSENLPRVKKVLEIMCAKEMSKGDGADEVMAFKYHYLSYVVGEIMKLRERHEKQDIVEVFSKKLLKPGRDGISLDFQETFVKEAIREFPYRECMIFRQMVISLGCKDPPSALYVVNTLINGQRGFSSSLPYCDTCGEEKPAKKCSKCKSVQYCDRECQRLHWFTHKKSCNRLSSTQAASSAPVSSASATQKPTVDAEELSEHLQELVKMS